ncbi:MAG: hypothetical protein AAFY06_10290 [Pseudomonadota bacterium]
MQQIFRWRDLISKARAQFPEINENHLILAHDNMGALVREVARAQELTLSEAAEMVVWRLPSYQIADHRVRLSA